MVDPRVQGYERSHGHRLLGPLVGTSDGTGTTASNLVDVEE
jgi:hypothetical protein